MELEGILERINRRLRRVGLSATAASKMAGKPDAIRNIRRAVETGNRKGVTTPTIAALAPVLQTTSAWLIEESGPEEITAPANAVPLVGYVGAGAEASFFDEAQGPLEFVEGPPGAKNKTVAVEVRGTSLGEIFDRWLIFYDERREPVTDDLLGELCVVGLDNGQVLVKKLKKGHVAGTYNLISNTEQPMYDRVVVWAAKVRHMTPR